MIPLSALKFFVAVGIALLLAGCEKDAEIDIGEDKVLEKTIEDVLAAHTGDWMSIDGVVGTAIGESDGRPCIRVLVSERTAAVEDRIPSKVDGHKVEITETGEIKALEDSAH